MEKEILTPEEVAEYLRVSEKTVYNWAQKGEIPAGKIGTAWRFKKSDIEEWVNKRLSPRKTEAQIKGILITEIFSRDRVLFLNQLKKRGALLELIDCISKAPQVKDREELKREIFNREELMSTGIGHGIAIPHVKIRSVSDLVGAVGISKNGIEDYQSLDDEPIRIIIMFAAASNQHAKYLKGLSYISSKLKNEEVRKTLLQSNDAQEVYDLLIIGE
jgi:PTS system nitrogen regulatory IIA component